MGQQISAGVAVLCWEGEVDSTAGVIAGAEERQTTDVIPVQVAEQN